jgi:hypothetical protein
MRMLKLKVKKIKNTTVIKAHTYLTGTIKNYMILSGVLYITFTMNFVNYIWIVNVASDSIPLYIFECIIVSTSYTAMTLRVINHRLLSGEIQEWRPTLYMVDSTDSTALKAQQLYEKHITYFFLETSILNKKISNIKHLTSNTTHS